MDPRTALTNAYTQYLGRAPEAGAIDWRIGQLGTTDLATQISQIANSPEAAARRGGNNSGTNPNPTALTDFATQTSNDWNALLDRQKTEQQGLFDQFTTKMGSQEALPALYSRLSNELGIPGLGQAVQGYKNEIYRVQGLLDRLDEDVTNRNVGTYMTEALRRRVLASEGDVLRTQASRLGTGMAPVADLLQSAQQSLSTMLPLYVQQQDRELEPLKLQINSISDRFAREITGFTQSKELQLNALMDKLERERTLADREWQLAQDLAKEQRAYAQQQSIASSYLSQTSGSGSKASATTPRLPTVSPAPKLYNVPLQPNYVISPTAPKGLTPGKMTQTVYTGTF